MLISTERYRFAVSYFAPFHRRRLAGRIPRSIVIVCLLMVWNIVGTVALCLAGEFRVDTLVYDDLQKLPIANNTTYFTDDAICDVSQYQGKSTALVIDRKTNTATICREQQQQACTVSLDEVLRTVAGITTRINDQQPHVVRFAANPIFESQWNTNADHNTNADTHELTMRSKPLTYVVRSQETSSFAAATEQAAADYREFADWSARISATGRGGLPPMARIQVNDALARKNQLPVNVKVARLTKSNQTATFHSKHVYQWQLNSKDRRAIAEWKSAAANWKAVDLTTLQFGERLSVKK